MGWYILVIIFSLFHTLYFNRYKLMDKNFKMYSGKKADLKNKIICFLIGFISYSFINCFILFLIRKLI